MYKNSPWTVVGVLAFGVAVGTMQMTVVVPVLPALQRELDAPLSTPSWTLTAALLSGAVSIPLLSRLGDLYGRRRMALASLGLLVTGSVAAALATTVAGVIAGRILQGMAAPLLPLAIGIVRQETPRDRLPTAIGVLSAMMGVGSGGGMILAGVVGDGYQVLFWTLAGLAAAAAALIAVCVRESPLPPTGARPDLAGTVLMAAWLVCLLLAVSKGASWGWASVPTLGLLAAAAVLLAAWVLSARRAAAPLVEIPMLLHPGTVGASVASLLLGFSLFCTITTLSSVAQSGLGASVLQVGLYLLPAALMMTAVSLPAGLLMRRFAASSLVGAGASTVVAAALGLGAAYGSPTAIYGATAVLGLGMGLGYAALGTMAVEHVEPAKTAAAGGVNALVRVVGSSLAGAVTAAVLPTAGPGWSFAAAAAAALVAAVFAFSHGALDRKPAPAVKEAM
ncbi:MFS transporter [Nocardiopsis trehalosi]|uniref:MFS transporter n=1 Tax=Nocardiopsis trehalosi TaxID=109329 RepID=UPI000836AC89|nr:MFS transporter [Nocardiopsis trehalosi]